MRIALVVHKFPPESIGGTEIYTRNLACEMSRQGHQVFVFYRGSEPSTEYLELPHREQHEFEAYRVPAGLNEQTAPPLTQFLDTFFNRDIERAFQRFLDEVDPEIIHFQHLMLLSYRLVALAKRRGIPTFLTLHDYWFICANSQLIWPDAQICAGKALGLNCARCALSARMSSSLMHFLRPMVAPFMRIRDILVRRAALKADRLIAPSHFLIQQYVEAGFPANKFTYLENGIDVERIQRYARQPSIDGKLRFTYLGSLAWQKGVHVLIEAFSDVPSDKAILRIYGDPTIFPDYAAHLEEIVNTNNTFFEGSVPNEEVGRVLAETDVIMVPSLWYENSPVVIQEAFAAGVPVIASSIGALREKVDVESCLFPVGDVDALRRTLHRAIVDKACLTSSEKSPSPHSISEAASQLTRLYGSHDLELR